MSWGAGAANDVQGGGAATLDVSGSRRSDGVRNVLGAAAAAAQDVPGGALWWPTMSWGAAAAAHHVSEGALLVAHDVAVQQMLDAIESTIRTKWSPSYLNSKNSVTRVNVCLDIEVCFLHVVGSRDTEAGFGISNL